MDLDSPLITKAHRSIGLALGGEAGARLAEHLALPTSADTLLRRAKAIPAAEAPLPRITFRRVRTLLFCSGRNRTAVTGGPQPGGDHGADREGHVGAHDGDDQ